MIHAYDQADAAVRAIQRESVASALASAEVARRLLADELYAAVDEFRVASDDVAEAATALVKIAARTIGVGRELDNVAYELKTLEQKR